MQVTVEAPQSLSSDDRKPRNRASRRGRGSANEERTETRGERLADEPPAQTWAAVHTRLPARGGGGKARDGTGEAAGASAPRTRKMLQCIKGFLFVFSIVKRQTSFVIYYWKPSKTLLSGAKYNYKYLRIWKKSWFLVLYLALKQKLQGFPQINT